MFLAVVLLALVVDSAATGSSGAKPPNKHHRLPGKFFGINPNARILEAHEFRRMRRGGIRSYRLPLYWVGRQAGPNQFDWTKTDLSVKGAAAAGVEIVPFVWGSPDWAWGSFDSPLCPKPDPDNGCLFNLPVGSPTVEKAWKDFLTAAVKRYGPGGQFWAEHPQLRPRPIRHWEIWNEENYLWFTFPISWVDYARLLKISRDALKAADPGSRIVLGGLFGEPYEKWPEAIGAADYLRRLYKVPGVKANFDAVAIHPYAPDTRSLKRQLDQYRGIMNRAGDKKTPIWLNEFGWSSRPPSDATLAKGPIGQKKLLVAAYRLLIANQRRWRVARTFWFSWDDDDRPNVCVFCDGSGLFSADLKPKPSWYGLVKLAGGKP